MNAIPDFSRVPEALDEFERFFAAGQGHVFALWNTLDESAQRHFVEHLQSIDLDRVAHLQTLLRDPPTVELAGFTAPSVIEPGRNADSAELQAAREVGENLLRQGRVAALVVAGGQASRLGFDAPKGCFPIGPVTGRSLFEIFARQLVAATHRYGKPVPWLVMTSETNHADTVAFFEAHDFWGLDRADVRFFRQGMLPALEASSGKLLLDGPQSVFLSPDGHGGVLRALRQNDLLGWLAGRRATQISYFQVDNLQARIVDPQFIGLHASSGCEFSAKIVEKIDPAEKVGLFVKRPDNKVLVVEYSDLTPEQMTARNADGRLTFRAANPALHVLDTAFVARITREESGLPLHVAHKAVPYLALEDGAEPRLVEPTEPNAFKFEQFIFDAMPLAARTVLLAIDRDAEFVPVKSADGPTSPMAVQRDYQRYWAGVLERVGVVVPRRADGELSCVLEVDSRYLLDGEDFSTLAARVRNAPLDFSAGKLFID